MLGSFTGDIKLHWFPLSMWVGRFCCFHMVCISSLSDVHCTTEVMNGDKVPVTEVTFILASVLNLELSHSQKIVPGSPNDTPFEKWLLTSAIYITILRVSLFLYLPLLLFLLIQSRSHFISCTGCIIIERSIMSCKRRTRFDAALTWVAAENQLQVHSPNTPSLSCFPVKACCNDGSSIPQRKITSCIMTFKFTWQLLLTEKKLLFQVQPAVRPELMFCGGSSVPSNCCFYLWHIIVKHHSAPLQIGQCFCQLGWGFEPFSVCCSYLIPNPVSPKWTQLNKSEELNRYSNSSQCSWWRSPWSDVYSLLLFSPQVLGMRLEPFVLLWDNLVSI